MKKSLRELCTAIAICFCATGNLFATDNQFNTGHTMDKNLNLTKEWDKVFPQSDKVSHSKVTFRNRYGITLAADMYKPKHADGKLPAIAISGPFGAVKEQSSGLYAQALAERGFQKRDVYLIENGSWAPNAARVMREMLANCKNVNIRDMMTIYSRLDPGQTNEIVTLAKDIVDWE